MEDQKKKKEESLENNRGARKLNNGDVKNTEKKKDVYPVDVSQLFHDTVNKRGSDLHLSAGNPPLIRVDGDLVKLEYPVLKPWHISDMVKGIVKEEEWEKLKEDWELDFSIAKEGLARFRVNVMYQRGSLAAVFRTVPFGIPDIKSLGLPETIYDLCEVNRGLVLVTGPTGSGKSTTLAAMIDYINNHRPVSIVTIEDPIEFLHKNKESSVKQREVGSDTRSFANALRRVLRHDPDIILIGEMRDLESISIALTAAETGHLVLSTLHTQTAQQTVSRIVDVFQDHQRQQVRQQLSNTLRAVVAQQLLPKKGDDGRAVAVEIMRDSNAVSNLIREGKEHQLYSTIQTSEQVGMQTLDRSLINLYQKGVISENTALKYCVSKEELERYLNK